MLTHIAIRNFAIIDELELDLFEGMTTLTGETGAGKSILLDALGLVLGDRADTNSVRHGSDKADITASFDTRDIKDMQTWLSENDLENDDECIVRRIISSDGRSKAYINGTSVTLQQLRTAGEMLIDIHGQHEHQSLMRKDMQRRLLDDYADNTELMEKVYAAYHTWFDSEEKYKALLADSDSRSERIELLRYQLSELEALDPQENEYAELSKEHDRLANIDKLMSTSASVSNRLYEDDMSVHQQLTMQINAIENLNTEDEDLKAINELLVEAQSQISEAATQARHYLDHLEANPERFTEVEQRLGSIHDQARKHRIEPDELFSHYQQLQTELDELDDPSESLDELKKRRDKFKQDYLKLAKQLSNRRSQTANKLGKQITEAMQTLNMTGGKFQINVEQAEPLKCSQAGYDTVEYMVSTNPGQPLLPLAKTASGGELARISLAIQMITAKQTRIPTLIFDEVDSGVGGATAEIVGQHLRRISENCQVMCVTHLPQVASQAHHHLQVSKLSSDNTTITRIKLLENEARKEEIARMLGGVEITQQTLNHAEEMISRAQSA